MSRVDDLLHAFDQTLDDGVLTRGERKALKQLIADAELDPIKQGALRAKVFDLAREHLSEWPAPRVISWLETANKLLLTSPLKEAAPRAYFSPGDAILNAIITQLNQARTSVRICVFTITDDRISDVLLSRHRAGIDIRIISDNDKAYDAGSDIQKLAAAGVPVRVDRTDDHMHHKFALIDNSTLLNGSYNWTRSAANDNYENLVISESPALIRQFRELFDVLWNKMREI